MIHRFRSVAALAVILAAGSLFAQTPEPAPAKDLAAVIAPYVNGNTIMVIHVDFAAVDTAAIEKEVKAALDAAKLPAEDQQEILAVKIPADAFLSKMKELGGRHFFFVLNAAANPRPNRDPIDEPTGFVTVEPGADAAKLAEFLKTDEAGRAPAYVLSDKLIAISDKPSTIEPANFTPAPRPEFEKGFAATPGALQIVGAMTPETRAALGGALGPLPPEIGGGSIDALLTGLEYASVGLELPPKLAVTLKVHAESPEAAAKANDSIAHAIDSIKEQLKQAPPPLQAMVTDIITTLTPKIDGSDLVVSLNSDQLNKLAQGVLPAMVGAKTRATQTLALAYARQNAMGLVMYENDNNGELPEKMEDIKKYVDGDKTFTNPADPKHRPFEYHQWTKDELKNVPMSETPLLWSTVDDDTSPVIVAFLDGHAELMKNKKALEEALAKAKEAAKAK